MLISKIMWQCPAVWAAYYGHLETVKLLLDNRADVNLQDECG